MIFAFLPHNPTKSSETSCIWAFHNVGLKSVNPTSTPLSTPLSSSLLLCCLLQNDLVIGDTRSDGTGEIHCLECPSYLNLRVMGIWHRRIPGSDNCQHLGTVHRSTCLVLLRFAEADLYHLADVLLLHELQIELLDASHFVVVEPVGRLQLSQFIDNLGIELVVVNLARVVDKLPVGNGHADVAAGARLVLQRMRIVGRCHERGITRTVFLRGTVDGTSVDLRLRECLLQRTLLRGTDGVELVEVYQQVVRQRHLLVELVREVQVVKIVLAQVVRQQAVEERGLTTALGTNERRYTLVAVQRVHLQPVGHSRTNPDGQERQVLRGESWQTAEELCHVVLSVPLRQLREVIGDGVVRAYLF